MKQQRQERSDDFRTFVETLERRRAAKKAPSRDPTRLLAALAESGPQAVPDLMAASGMAAMDFLEVLKTLREVGLVALAGEPGKERVELTPNGRQVAQLGG